MEPSLNNNRGVNVQSRSVAYVHVYYNQTLSEGASVESLKVDYGLKIRWREIPGTPAIMSVLFATKLPLTDHDIPSSLTEMD